MGGAEYVTCIASITISYGLQNVKGSDLV